MSTKLIFLLIYIILYLQVIFHLSNIMRNKGTYVLFKLLYIFRTHPTRHHPTRRNDKLTRRAWNQRGMAQVIQYEIYIYNYVNQLY